MGLTLREIKNTEQGNNLLRFWILVFFFPYEFIHPPSCTARQEREIGKIAGNISSDLFQSIYSRNCIKTTPLVKKNKS